MGKSLQEDETIVACGTYIDSPISIRYGFRMFISFVKFQLIGLCLLQTGILDGEIYAWHVAQVKSYCQDIVVPKQP